MKFSTIILTSLLAVSAHAGIGMSIRTTGNVLISPFALSVAFVESMAECVSGSGDIAAVNCGGASVSGTAISLSSSSAVALLKEEVRQVEVDAYDYLAGGEMTLALADQMHKLRGMSPKVAALSDAEIIALMLEITK